MRERYFNERIRQYFEEEKLAEAAAYCAVILQQLGGASGKPHRDVAHVLDNMARAYYYLGDYRSALEATKGVVRIDCSKSGPVTADCVRNLSNLALNYRLTGYIEEAELVYERALALIEALPTDEEWDRTITLIGRAQVHEIKHEFAPAERLLLEAARIRARASGGCSPGLALVFDNLAGLYHRMGKSLAAERAIRKAIRLYRNSATTESINYAASIRLLARLLLGQSKLSEARALMNESLAILRRICAPGHPERVKAESLAHELAG